MGIFSSNKEILSMLEAFKREADKRIGRLEAIAKKSKSESLEFLTDIKAYSEVVSFLSAIVHLSRLDDKEGCESGVKALSDKLSSLGKIIEVNEADFNMAQQLAADIEIYDEDLKGGLADILACIEVSNK